MTTPNQPESSAGQPGSQPQWPSYPSQYPTYGQQYGHGGYPAPGYGVDAAAPYGRDPVTGVPLSDKSQVAAGCLQLFFGMFGVGRFYIGSVAIGAIQLGLTVVGVVLSIVFVGLLILAGVGIWAFVDAIMMFTGSVPDGNGRKLR